MDGSSFRTAEERAFSLLVSSILTYRKSAWLILIGLTLLATVGNFRPWWITRFIHSEEVPQQIEQTEAVPVDRPPDVKPFRYSSGEVILVAESEDFFTPSGATAMRAVVEQIKALPYIENVVWLEDAPPLNLFSLAEPVLPKANASIKRFEVAKQRAVENPLIGGQLLSDDGTLMLIMLDIDWLLVTEEGDGGENIKQIAEATAKQHAPAKIRFSYTGGAPLRQLAAASHETNQLRYQLIGYLVIIVFAAILFRGIAAVIIVALAPIVGVYWTLGALRILELHDNPFNEAVLPVLLAMVGFTDGVHMMVQIRRRRSEGLNGLNAARTALREVGFACFLTSLTTGIGFASLMLAHHEIVQEFGQCCVIGVSLTLLSALTVIPLLCATRFGQSVASGYGNNLIDRNLEKSVSLIDFVLKHDRVFAWAGIILTCILIAIASALSPDEKKTTMLPDDAEPVVALRTIDKKLKGMETGNVIVRWSNDIASDAPEVGQVMHEVHDLLMGEPLIGHPLSIYNLVQALPGDGPMENRMSLLELMPPPLKRAFYTPEYRYAECRFRVQDLGVATYDKTFTRINDGLQQIQTRHPSFSLDLSGDAIWRWNNLYRIMMDLCYSLGSAAIIIFAVLTIVYRSPRLGLISIIPNVFPLAATGCLLVAAGEHLELVSVCAFTVCLGIAVDDTIHFLTRFREESFRCDDCRAAVRRSFVGVGSALIITTLVLVVGMSTALASQARETRVFVTMGMLTIGTALIGDMIFLPAMITYFRPKKQDQNQADNTDEGC